MDRHLQSAQNQPGPAVRARERLDVFIDRFRPNGRPETREIVMRADSLRKSFHKGIWPIRRDIEVLKGASAEVRQGEMVGLVGENGSGKSTIMKILVGLLERDSGTVEIDGKLGYCPQIPMLWDKLTVDEHFRLFTRAYRMSDHEGMRSATDLLEELNFSRYKNYRVEDLSGGTRQKLNLALALMHKPDLLLLDEPYAGFDWETYLRFWEMSEQRRDQGMGILVVSHFLTERDRLDRVFQIKDGICVEEK